MRRFPVRSASPGRCVVGLALLLAACAPAGRDIGIPGAADATLTAAEAGQQAERLVRMGAAGLERGDAATAARLLERAVQLDPHNDRAATLLGRALLALDRPRDAAEAFRMVVERRPDDAAAGAGYARAMLALDRPEVAAEHLETLPARARDRKLVSLLGVALTLSGRHERAIDVLRAGLARWPGDLALTNNLALALAFAGRPDEAIALLEPVGRAVSADRRTRQNLALVYGLAGRFEDAERLSRIDLDDAAVANNLTLFRLLAARPDKVPPASELVPSYRPSAADVVELGAAPATRTTGPVAERTPRDPPFPDDPVTAEGAVGSDAVDNGGAGAPVALIAGEPAAAPREGWVLRLGLFSDEARAVQHWQQLEARYADAVAGLSPLPADGPGPRPLLVGMLPSREAAERACTALREGGASCHPLRR